MWTPSLKISPLFLPTTGSFCKQVCPVILFLSSVVQNRRIPFCQDMSVILPNYQEPRGAVGSMMTTISPTVKFLRDFVPEAVEDIPLSTFSKTDQTDIGLVAIFVWYTKSLFWKSPGGRNGFDLNCKIWFGVRTSKSFGSSESFVIGRSLRIASASQRTVWKLSSSNHCCWSVEYNTFFTSRITLSHIPPWCDPAGVLKVHFIPSDRKVLWIVPWSKLFKTFLSSLCAPIKLVPLTDLKCSTWPRRHIKRRIQFMQEFVSRE